MWVCGCVRERERECVCVLVQFCVCARVCVYILRPSVATWCEFEWLERVGSSASIGMGERQCVAVCCSILQCVAVCCSVLQCIAVCCSVLLRASAGANGRSVRVLVCMCMRQRAWWRDVEIYPIKIGKSGNLQNSCIICA